MSRRYQSSGGHWLPVGTRQGEKQMRAALLVRDGFRCAYCGLDLRDAGPKVVTLDHLRVKRSRSNHPDNLVVACRACNARRGKRSWRALAGPRPTQRILEVVQRPCDMELGAAYLEGTLQTEPLVDPVDVWERRPGERHRWFHPLPRQSTPVANVCETVRESAIIVVSERKGDEVSTTRSEKIRSVIDLGNRIDLAMDGWKSNQVSTLQKWLQSWWGPLVNAIQYGEDQEPIDLSPITSAIADYLNTKKTNTAGVPDAWSDVRHSVREVISRFEDALNDELGDPTPIDWDAVAAAHPVEDEAIEDDDSSEEESGEEPDSDPTPEAEVVESFVSEIVTRDAYRCEDGCDLTEDEPAGGQYSCDNDGNFSAQMAFDAGRSRKNQCPECGRMCGKEASLGCDDCGAEVTAITAYLCPSCAILHESEAEARECCGS